MQAGQWTDTSVWSGAGIEACIQTAIVFQASDPVAPKAIHVGEVASDDEAAIGLPHQRVTATSCVEVGTKTPIQAAGGVEPNDLTSAAISHNHECSTIGLQGHARSTKGRLRLEAF